MRPNPVKATLANGGCPVGTMVFEFFTPGMSAVCAAAGADFVVFDQEATGCSIEKVATLMATARGLDIVGLVRVPSGLPHLLARPLDVGASGLMVPMVESAAQAAAIVDATKYPPWGNRGVISGLANDDFAGGADVAAGMQSANAETLLIAQIESAAGVERVEQIAAVPGVDVLWIGHLDLTVSLGIPGRYDHPDFTAAVARVLAAAHAAGKAAAVKVGSVDEGRRRMADGFRCICYGDDVRLLRDGLGSAVAALRQA